MRRLRTAIGLGAALALAVTACAGETLTDDTLPAGTAPGPTVLETAGSLVQFDRCEAFLDYVVSHAVDLVGPYGFEGDPGFWPTASRFLAAEEAIDSGGESGVPTFSETNIQVEGVDEPDIVKTDGSRIVVLAEGNLIVLDVTGEHPVEIGRLSLDRQQPAQSLFLSGDTVLLFGSVWSHHPFPLAEADRAVAPGFSAPTVQITEVDIEGGDPVLVRTMTIDGALVSGRMVDDTVRLVLTSGPVGFEWSYPEGSGLRAEREAVEKNREVVRASTEENWIPYYIVKDEDGDVIDEGVLFDCDRATHPDEFSGLDMLSIVTVDLGNGLDVVDATGLLATGHTVYASAESLYVATQNWESWIWAEAGEESGRLDAPTTDIHEFDISHPRATTYAASGSVEGYLLNQFAMDEHEGVLRVASTTTPNWWGSGPDSESRVTVMSQVGDRLVGIGMVDGLGETEQIYSVRFIGDIGYVVTFRQTDPLYTVDLSNPRDPRVIGELKIPGYSAYLHPVGEDLIMGIGQDATDQGVVQGTQVSVFDVSDLSDPNRVDAYTLSEGTSSQVEYDHHAFLYWEGLAMIPVQQWHWDEETEEVFMGVVGLRMGDDGALAEAGEVVHPGGEGKDWDWRAQVLRTLVIGDSVYTISQKGAMKSSLGDLGGGTWLEFGAG